MNKAWIRYELHYQLENGKWSRFASSVNKDEKSAIQELKDKWQAHKTTEANLKWLIDFGKREGKLQIIRGEMTVIEEIKA